MDCDTVIRLAREAGLDPDLWNYTDAFERFAALVAAAAVRETSAEYRLGWNDGQMMEREACAKLCDEQVDSPALAPLEKCRAGFIADAIRSRT